MDKKAYIALYHMANNIDYCIFKNEDIIPFSFILGKKNIPSVYSGGLHQILEIKHKLRIKDEFLPIMFFSNASFFLKYKINDEFLFFGLTGTIEYPEIQNICTNIFLNSKILFMPQYKKKRFMELPLKLSDFEKHFDDICEDIINNFHKGRKILVICSCLLEAKEIKKKLELFGIGIENIKIKYPNIFKDQIILNDNKELYNKKVKIILSIKLEEIETDIKSSKEEEKNEGLHIIITSIDKNYFTTTNKIFDRFSRKGKKGTGQIILSKENDFCSYSELMNKIKTEEKIRVDHIKNHLRIVLFEDKLFNDFIEIIKNKKIDRNTYLFNDVMERWAFFLKDKIINFKIYEFNENKIEKEFDKFKTKIISIINKAQDYEKYNNPFLKIADGLKKYNEYQKGLNDYLDDNLENKIFFFTIPYLKAIILIKNQQHYNYGFFNKVLVYLNEARFSVHALIDRNIAPTLNILSQWEELNKNLKNELHKNKFYENEQNENDKKYITQKNIYIQYNNIKNILIKICDKLKVNIDFIEYYKAFYENNDKYCIIIMKEDLIEGLNLNKSYENELNFFNDACFFNVFSFKIAMKKNTNHSFSNIKSLDQSKVFNLNQIIEKGYLISVFSYKFIPHKNEEKKNNYEILIEFT